MITITSSVKRAIFPVKNKSAQYFERGVRQHRENHNRKKKMHSSPPFTDPFRQNNGITSRLSITASSTEVLPSETISGLNNNYTQPGRYSVRNSHFRLRTIEKFTPSNKHHVLLRDVSSRHVCLSKIAEHHNFLSKACKLHRKRLFFFS